MNRTILRNLEYLKQNYKPSEIQKLLNSRKIKREVYQELKVSEYVLNNYIKHNHIINTYAPITAYIGILEQCFQNYLNTFCKNIF